MPPKDAKKISKLEKDLLDEDQELNDELVKYALRLTALKSQLSVRAEQLSGLKINRDELRAACTDTEDKLHLETTDRLHILTDFARQYKTGENDKISLAIKLEAALNNLEEEKLKAAEELKRVEAEYDDAINKTRSEYNSLTFRISEMEGEFGVIMEKTHTKVSAHA